MPCVRTDIKKQSSASKSGWSSFKGGAWTKKKTPTITGTASRERHESSANERWCGQYKSQNIVHFAVTWFLKRFYCATWTRTSSQTFECCPFIFSTTKSFTRYKKHQVEKEAFFFSPKRGRVARDYRSELILSDLHVSKTRVGLHSQVCVFFAILSKSLSSLTHCFSYAESFRAEQINKSFCFEQSTEIQYYFKQPHIK